MSVAMPPMTGPQQAAWHALMDVQVIQPTGWTLVGGQLVHRHCAERGASPARPTDNVDAVLDVRAEPRTLHGFTTALSELGFKSAGETWTGHQHRWERGEASVDILIPRHLGETAATRKGTGGGSTIEKPGAQQSLDRTDDVAVTVADRTGAVFDPALPRRSRSANGSPAPWALWSTKAVSGWNANPLLNGSAGRILLAVRGDQCRVQVDDQRIGGGRVVVGCARSGQRPRAGPGSRRASLIAFNAAGASAASEAIVRFAPRGSAAPISDSRSQAASAT